MILVIDNYDSFTFNLVQYLGELGAEIQVHRNDRISLEEIAALRPTGIVISPGPGRPEHAGISVELIRRFGAKIPILGVCLGHQAVGIAFGGAVVSANLLMHGKTSEIHHKSHRLFQGLHSPFIATRYHSLVVRREHLPTDLVVTAETDDRTIMGLQHRRYPTFGVQFHPESILTTEGKPLLKNFLEISAS